jgi:hypothetical protein
MLLVTSVTRRLQILCVPLDRINGRTPECKWNLLKVRKGKYKGSMVGAGGVCWQREPASLLQVLLKLTLTYGKGGPGDFHPIINE